MITKHMIKSNNDILCPKSELGVPEIPRGRARDCNTSSIFIRCFSRFSLQEDGKPVDLHSSKAEELMAFIACVRGTVSKRRAAEVLWSNAEPERAIKSLYQTLRHIRKMNLCGVITETRGALTLGGAADVEEFLRMYESAEPKDWERAIELYRGILLIDNGYDWAIEYEAYYDVRYYEMLGRLAEHYEAVGNRNMALYYRNKASE